MRHSYFGNQLGRNTKGARALYRSLLIQLFDHGKIETTVAKAKAIVPSIDRVINFAKKNTIAARREVAKILGSSKSLDKVFTDIAPKFTNRNSGYSRIIRLGERYSDSARMVILELVEGVEFPKNEASTSLEGSRETKDMTPEKSPGEEKNKKHVTKIKLARKITRIKK